MAQSFNEETGTISKKEHFENAQDLWDFVQKEFENGNVDYIKITRNGGESISDRNEKLKRLFEK